MIGTSSYFGTLRREEFTQFVQVLQGQSDSEFFSWFPSFEDFKKSNPKFLMKIPAKPTYKETLWPISILAALYTNNQAKYNKTKTYFAYKFILPWFIFGRKGTLMEKNYASKENYNTPVMKFQPWPLFLSCYYLPTILTESWIISSLHQVSKEELGFNFLHDTFSRLPKGIHSFLFVCFSCSGIEILFLL